MKVLVLIHKDLIPPEGIKPKEAKDKPFNTEYDVIESLKRLGHEVHPIGVDYDLNVLRKAIEEIKPNIVFNLLVEFADEALYDQNIVSYLELKRVPYTGCNPRGLMIARDKALSKQILHHSRIPVPKFFVVSKNNKVKIPKNMGFPMIVKSLTEEASFGISQASVVDNKEKLIERVQFIHEKVNTDAIVEEYIDGREFYVGILGNKRLQVLPVWELNFGRAKDEAIPIYTSRAKWNEKYREKYGIRSAKAMNLSQDEIKKIEKICKKAYKKLSLNGYARLDLRYTSDGELYIIEANPNPGIASKEEFPESANWAKLKYDDLMHRITSLGISWYQARN